MVIMARPGGARFSSLFSLRKLSRFSPSVRNQRPIFINEGARSEVIQLTSRTPYRIVGNSPTKLTPLFTVMHNMHVSCAGVLTPTHVLLSYQLFPVPSSLRLATRYTAAYYLGKQKNTIYDPQIGFKRRTQSSMAFFTFSHTCVTDCEKAQTMVNQSEIQSYSYFAAEFTRSRCFENPSNRSLSYFYDGKRSFVSVHNDDLLMRLTSNDTLPSVLSCKQDDTRDLFIYLYVNDDTHHSSHGRGARTKKESVFPRRNGDICTSHSYCRDTSHLSNAPSATKRCPKPVFRSFIAPTSNSVSITLPTVLESALAPALAAASLREFASGSQPVVTGGSAHASQKLLSHAYPSVNQEHQLSTISAATTPLPEQISLQGPTSAEIQKDSGPQNSAVTMAYELDQSTVQEDAAGQADDGPPGIHEELDAEDFGTFGNLVCSMPCKPTPPRTSRRRRVADSSRTGAYSEANAIQQTNAQQHQYGTGNTTAANFTCNTQTPASCTPTHANWMADSQVLVKMLFKAARNNVRDDKLWKTFAQRVVLTAVHMTADQLALTLHSFARVRYFDARMVQTLSPLILRLLDDFSIQGLTLILNAFKKLNVHKYDTMELIVNQLCLNLSKGASSTSRCHRQYWCTAQDIALAANALSFFYVYHVRFWKLVLRLLSSLAWEIDASHAALLVSSFARIDLRDGSALLLLARICKKKVLSLDQAQLSVAVSAFSKLDFFHSKLTIAFHRAVWTFFSQAEDPFDMQALCLLIHTTVCLTGGSEKLICKLLQAITQKNGSLAPHQTRKLCHACLVLRCHFTDIYDRLEQSVKEFLSRVMAEMRTQQGDYDSRWSAEVMRSLHDMGITFQRKVKFDGVKVDIFLPQKRVGIICAGPHHYYLNSIKRTAYSKLQQRLLEMQNISICVLPYYEWSELQTPEEKLRFLWFFGRRAAQQMRSGANGEVEQRRGVDKPGVDDLEDTAPGMADDEDRLDDDLMDIDEECLDVENAHEESKRGYSSQD